MSIFDRFWRKSDQRSDKPSDPALLNNDASESVWNSPLRAAVGTLYDNGVDPLQAILAMMSEHDGQASSDDKRMVAIWLGINDLLDRDAIGLTIRGELAAARGLLGKALTDMNQGLNEFVTSYLAASRRISSMKALQAYEPGLYDANGIMQRDAVTAMLADIERLRDTEPGARAQDISDETLAGLYSLRDNWDDPRKFSNPIPNAQAASRGG